MWKDDEAAEWKDFVPDEPSYTAHGRSGTELLGEADWRKLSQAIGSGYEPLTAAQLVGRAYEVLEGGDLRYAVAEAVTALEVGLGEMIRSRVGPLMSEKIKAFWNLSITAQLATAATLVAGLDQDQLRLAFEAIEMRHRVVHEGETPAQSSSEAIRALLRVAAHFIGGPPFKFPIVPTGRTLYGAPP